MNIDIGNTPFSSDAGIVPNYTLISLNNPANATGNILSVQIYAYGTKNITGMIVGIFYLVSGTTYKCRSSVAIGTVPYGSLQTFDISATPMAVIAGDFIGCYYTAGYVADHSSGGSGLCLTSGEHIDPGDEASYTTLANYMLALYGEGATPAVGFSRGFIIG
jgi:hypothetical protein